MIVVRGRAQLGTAPGEAPRAPAFAIGNFDGVHLGHRRLVETARSLAAPRGAQTAVLTFDPHPARLFAPELAPPLIVPLARRIELLGEAGVDLVVVEPFTPDFAAISAEDFVARVLGRDLGARDVVVGGDFSFGRGRAGDASQLERLAAASGLGVVVLPQVTAHGLVCSSTKIREFVLEGRVDGAALLLGRPFEIDGEVVRGAGRGRGIGFPTANLRPEGELLPKGGVYAGRARRLDAPGGWPVRAAINVGTNPTFVEQGGLSIEAHLLDFDGDLYGGRVRLELVRRLRDERRFPDAAALAAQIEDDVGRTRREIP